MNIENTPYANLDPSLILDAIESTGLRCTGSLLALNSFENRVYQVGIEDATPVIAKFYRPERWTDAAIIEEHEFSLELVQHDIPVVAPLALQQKTLHTHNGFRFAVFPRQGGRPLELDNLEQLEWMGRFLGRMHAVGAIKPFQHRITFDIQTYGYQPYQYLLDNQFIPAEVKHNYCYVMDALLDRIADCLAKVGEYNVLRLHGDCHAGNVLWNNQGPMFVDLDDCLMGPAIQDIWMLLSGDQAQVDKQLDTILAGYEEFFEFDENQLHLIEVCRSLRMIHYTGWLAKRWQDPAFPLNFPWFNTPRYWQEQIQHLTEQVSLIDLAMEKRENFGNR